MLYNNLPVYRAEVNDEQEGMFCISLVDDPAVEANFLVFDKDKELITFSVEDEERHLVRGLIMAADFLIYRRDTSGYEYYIKYDAETIRYMAEKYLKDGLQNTIDTQHNGNLVEGVNMVQFFIKDSENGISPKGFEDYKDGSLFAEFHVENEEIWKQIKEGTFKGFSLAGIFDVVETFSDDYKEEEEIVDILNKLLNRIK